MSAPVEGETFTCGRCQGVFTKGWTDAESQAEYEQLMPAEAAAGHETDYLCDGCYGPFVTWLGEL